MELDLSKSSRAGLKLLCSPEGREQTVMAYDRKSQKLTVHREQSSLDPECSKTSFSAHLNLTLGKPLKLHIFLDWSVIEIFANDTICLTSRVYPTRADSIGVKLFSEGGNALIKSLDSWEMKSAR